jgi:ATP:corrinoid adenosyltransferase
MTDKNKTCLIKLRDDMFSPVYQRDEFYMSVINDIDEYQQYCKDKYTKNKYSFFIWDEVTLTKGSILLKIDEYEFVLNDNIKESFIRILTNGKLFWAAKTYFIEVK